MKNESKGLQETGLPARVYGQLSHYDDSLTHLIGELTHMLYYMVIHAIYSMLTVDICLKPHNTCETCQRKFQLLMINGVMLQSSDTVFRYTVHCGLFTTVF